MSETNRPIIKSLKKEFITTWSQQHITPQRDNIHNSLFDVKTEKYEIDYSATTAILPDDIKFLDLVGFQGKTTKVTIEVIG